jgi:hypothetical protein
MIVKDKQLIMVIMTLIKSMVDINLIIEYNTKQNISLAMIWDRVSTEKTMLQMIIRIL